MTTSSQFFHIAAGSPTHPDAISAAQWAKLPAKKRPATPPGGACYLCGAEIDGAAVPTADRIDNKTWTAHGAAKAPAADWICLGCMATLNEAAVHPAQPKPFKMRTMTHLVVGRTWTVLGLSDKRRMAAVLLDPPRADPWLLCICAAPLSAGHALYRTPVNPASAAGWWITLGGALIPGSADRLHVALRTVEAQYAAGHSKTAIASGAYTPKWILAQGESHWAELEARITVMRGTPIFELALFLAQKGTEIE